MSIRLPRSLLWLTLILAAAARAAATPPPELPLEVFFGNAQISQLQISPDGRYLAMLQPINNRMNITVIDRVKGTKKRLTDMKEENVTEVSWMSDDRLGFRQQFKGQESFGYYAVNADGSKLSVLQQLVARDGESVINAPVKQYQIVDTLPNDPDYILVSVLRGSSGLGDLYKQHVVTEKFTKVMDNPGKIRQWVTDRVGVVRMGISSDEKTDTRQILYRTDAKSPWVLIEDLSFNSEWVPLGFDGDNRTLFIRTRNGRSTSGIYTYDPEQKKITGTVFENATYDASGIIYNDHLKKVVAVTYEAEKPEIIWIEPTLKQLAADIDAALPGTKNVINSITKDNRLVIVRSYSDRDPGTYYLLDAAKMELSELMRINDQVNPAQMAEMRPVQFQARDGLNLHGYLTLPTGREAKGLPLIIHPHGGPYGVRDSWRFNAELQFLANRGYAVLQINYRGSGGYGLDFMEAGFREWGLKMQDDLTDGVKWAVAQGIADPANVGIYGASYGGYATLAGLVYTPDLYKVGINYVGVSDISRLGIMLQFRGAGKIFQKFIGRQWLNPDVDVAQMKATSPINFIQKIRVPTLHAYGKYDPRVTIDQGDVLKAELKKHGKDFEYIEVENEGHGFRNLENRMGFYLAVETFLKKHMPVENAAGVKIGPTKVIQMPAKTD